MKQRQVCILLALCIGHLAAAQETRRVTQTGNLVEIKEFESKNLKNKRSIHVYLPPQYQANLKQKFPVLYLQDGQNCFNGFTSYLPNKEWRADESAQMLIQANLIEPIIIVAVDNAGADRANEFLPVEVKQRTEKYGGKADLYMKFICEEVKPMIDKEFRTLSDRSHTGIAGSSFGGVISLHAGLTKSDVFSKVGAFSPSLWVGNGLQVRQFENLSSKLPLKLWVDMGGDEGPGALEGLDAFGKVLTTKGWKAGKDLAVVSDAFAPHNEDSWARRFPAFLMFMYGKK
ncbi:MAG: alpha/beta hydrolase [Armatimonadetes bacterium]|nr:alpha/beta hydrolase [Armatimonadota bacterium]